MEIVVNSVLCEKCGTHERIEVAIGYEVFYLCKCSQSQVTNRHGMVRIRYGSIMDIAIHEKWRISRPQEKILDFLKASYSHTYDIICPIDGTPVTMMAASFEDWSEVLQYNGHVGTCVYCNTDFEMLVKKESNKLQNDLLDAWEKEEPDLGWMQV